MWLLASNMWLLATNMLLLAANMWLLALTRKSTKTDHFQIKSLNLRSSILMTSILMTSILKAAPTTWSIWFDIAKLSFNFNSNFN